ncbi:MULTISPECIES: Ycf51 family protein [Spirulina sp. CCY15215]|uniref:Ycf51 family protein n=1 Tax=Spirulina sp. CCY15215 TaxID=2767591 RepID=UPI0019510C8F|nr:Ycf51 family protein [Spirulina major]
MLENLPIPTDLAVYTQWCGILTLVLFVITILAFLLKWGLRFRLFGATAFAVVLTVGFFGLNLGLFKHIAIPGSVRYTLVFDNAADNVVLVIPPETTRSQVEATLRQAAIDISPFGRLAMQDNMVTIRARTVIHPEPGLSLPLYLGEAKKPSNSRDPENITIELFPANWDKLSALDS